MASEIDDNFGIRRKLDHITRRVAKGSFPYPAHEESMEDELAASRRPKKRALWLTPAKLVSITEAIATPKKDDPDGDPAALGSGSTGQLALKVTLSKIRWTNGWAVT
jgi:hypothetical protein